MGYINVDNVRAHVEDNMFYEGSRVIQGKDIFVPSNNKYPHVHIGPDYVVYSKGSNNHMYMVERGGQVQNGRVLTARQDSGNAEIMQICGYITSQQT